MKKINTKEPYGFWTEEAQKAFDSVNFEFAHQLFEKNNWTYDYGERSHVPSIMELKDIVRQLLKDMERKVMNEGTPEDFDYSASTGRWDIKYTTLDEYEINLKLNDYKDYNDDDFDDLEY